MINVIKASAGSGKTYQLTYEYIKLLLGVKRKGRYTLADESLRERHRHILAVTFTNKATGEMKERIVKELSILAGRVPDKKSPYMRDLCRDFGTTDEEAVKKAAYLALVDLLFDYTNFNVSTIDSFFQMILRTFAKELKMSYNYDIELDDDYAIKVGVNDFLSSLAHDKGVDTRSAEAKRVRRAKAWIREFVRGEVANNKSWNIFLESEKSEVSKSSFGRGFSFNDFAHCLTKEELRVRIDDIVSYLGYDDENVSDRIGDFKRYLNNRVQSCKHDAVASSRRILELAESAGLTVDDMNSNGGLAWILKITEDNIDCGLGAYATAKMLSSVDKSEKWYKKASTKKCPLSESTINDIKGCIYAIAENNRLFLIFKEMHRNVFMLGLLSEISRYLSKFRKENDLILLADTNELLHRIINNEDTPFVYERVGIWLSHFLIDEFQDTSRAQWDNMKPLLFNSCAEGSDNLIIGDEKQCIYRFRNADSSLLRTEVGHHFTVKQNDSGKCTNWRSTPKVVEFNNSFFTTIAGELNAKEEYGNVEQDLPVGKKYANEGYVEMRFIEGSTKDDSDEKVKFKDEALNRLPDVIKDMRSRGYKYKDIAVLVSTNSQGADVIKRILDYNAGKNDDEPVINVISNESLMLKNSPVVRLVVSHLRYLDSKMMKPQQTKGKPSFKDKEGYMHRVLRHYESLMFKHGMSPGEALEESIATVPQIDEQDEMSLMALLPENTESFNIVSITEHIIAQNISEDDLRHENAFVQAFQDSVVDFSNRPNATIHELLRWWDRGGCNTSVNSPDGQDAINVLTIHKSKGLEFRCVIIPFCDWDLAGKDEVLWIPKETAIESELFSGLNNEVIPPVIPLLPKTDMDLDNTGLKEFCAEKLQSRIIDGLNKTYVGFTRAIDELYIYSPEPPKTESPTKMPSLLQNLACDENGVYVSGEKGVYVEDKNKDKKEVGIVDMPLYKVENVKMEYVVPDLCDNEQRQRGTRLHNVFKRIRYKEDADTALLYFRTRGMIPRDDYDNDRKVVMDALADERVQSWFSKGNKVYNERSMVQAFKKSRPDRFISTPDGRTIVIDYKFGEAHLRKYHTQVKKYMDILDEIGFKNIEGYLWYPLEEKIEKINR